MNDLPVELKERIIDLRDTTREQRESMIGTWLLNHLNCVDHGGHRIEEKLVYDQTIKAWISHCEKCGQYRVHSSMGNDMWIHPSLTSYAVIIFNDEFDKPQKIFEHVLESIAEGILSKAENTT